MAEKLKNIALNMASYFSIYEIGIVLTAFFVFIMFFLFGLLLRGRRFLPSICFFLALMVVISTPIVLHLCMQNILYAISVEIKEAHIMQYTKGFFVAGNITHNGKIPINECLIAVNEVRDENGSDIIKMLNTILPSSSFKKTIDVDIQNGESAKFAVIVPDVVGKEPFLYRVYVDCYYSNQLTKKYAKNQNKDDDSIKKPQPPSTYVESPIENEYVNDEIIKDNQAETQNQTTQDQDKTAIDNDEVEEKLHNEDDLINPQPNIDS